MLNIEPLDAPLIHYEIESSIYINPLIIAPVTFMDSVGYIFKISDCSTPITFFFI